MFFKDYLSEATNLTASELEKPNSTTKESRVGILAKLIKANKPLERVKGKPFVVIDIESALAAIEQFKKDGKNFTLGMDGDTPVMNHHLKKSKAFGGGVSGAGGGTLNTAIVESTQCLWIASMLHEGLTNPIEHYTDEVLKKHKKYIDVGKTSMDQMLAVDDSWKTSSYLSAKYLIVNGYVNKNQKFHRDSKTMNAIYSAKNDAFKNNNMGKFKDDKWNPGDIWAVDTSFSIKELDTSTVKQLNRSILDGFVSRRCVGISLKKVNKKAKAKEFNVKLPPDVADHKIVSTQLSSNKGTFWSAKAGQVNYDEGKIAIMANSSMGTNKMEILGKTARGGSIGWGVIIDSAKFVFGRKMRPHAQIKRLALGITKKKDKRARSVFFKMINDTSNKMSRKEFDDNIDTKDAPWVAAKLGAVLVCRILELNKGAKANRFITKIINYAGSKSEDSSSYLKVYE
jgi:hypothetical protein